MKFLNQTFWEKEMGNIPSPPPHPSNFLWLVQAADFLFLDVIISFIFYFQYQLTENIHGTWYCSHVNASWSMRLVVNSSIVHEYAWSLYSRNCLHVVCSTHPFSYHRKGKSRHKTIDLLFGMCLDYVLLSDYMYSNNLT